MSVSLESQINFNDRKNELPLEFSQSMMHSNDLDVLSKKQREIIPRELSSFGFENTANMMGAGSLSNKLTFYCSDPRMYMDMLNSYFTADFKAICATSGDVALASFLDVGGIHSCIKTLTIKIGGTVLLRLDDYNKWYNINNLATHSPQYVDYMLGNSLDSMDDMETERDVAIQVPTTTASLNAATFSAAGIIGSLTAGDGLRAQVGDLIRIRGNAGDVQYGRVRSVGSTSIALSPHGAAVWIAETATNVLEITVIARRYEPTRANCVNFGFAAGAAACVASSVLSQKIQWRLPVGCLSFLKYFPLPYIQDVAPLEVEYEFVDARLALCLRDGTAANANNKMGYLLSKPRFIVSLVEPSNKVREQHDMLYNGNGLWFPYLNYRHFQNRIASNDTDITATFQSNVSSARHVMAVISSQTADDANTLSTQAAKSQSAFFRSQLNYFRFQSGSLQFPDYGNCQCGDAFASEAWAQLLLAFNIKENTVIKSRIAPHEWQSRNSDKFIIATPLAKDDTLFTGVSLRNNFLEFTINKEAVAVSYNLHSYLGYDCALVLQRDASARIFD